MFRRLDYDNAEVINELSKIQYQGRLINEIGRFPKTVFLVVSEQSCEVVSSLLNGYIPNVGVNMKMLVLI
jgi:hypothetical protein